MLPLPFLSLPRRRLGREKAVGPAPSLPSPFPLTLTGLLKHLSRATRVAGLRSPPWPTFGERELCAGNTLL